MSMRADLVTRLLGHTPLVAIVGSAVSWFEKDRGEFDPDGERQDGGPMALEGNLV